MYTIYFKSELMGNIVTVKARTMEHGICQYAQYPSAVKVTFVPKGKTNQRQFFDYGMGIGPLSTLILEGVGHPESSPLYVPGEWNLNGSRIDKGRYMSHDPRWVTEFNTMINEYIDALPGVVIADYRGHDCRMVIA
jgi:hypothetical protein